MLAFLVLALAQPSNDSEEETDPQPVHSDEEEPRAVGIEYAARHF